MTNEHISFRKIYLSHFIRNCCERVTKGLCVRGELETEQTATYWPPVPLSLTVLLSCSVGLLNRGSWGLIALCWVLVLSTASYLQLDCLQTGLPVAPGYIIVWHPPASCERCIRTQFNPDIFDRMHMFLDWRLGQRSICYTQLSSKEEELGSKVQNFKETLCTSHCTNILVKSMNPIILPPPIGK